MSLSRWLAGGTLVVAVLTALTIALWPQSDADKARSDGEKFGNAVAELRDAETTSDVHDGLGDLNNAVHDTREHLNDAVSGQASEQGDAIYHTVNGLMGAASTDEGSWDQDLYEEEFDQAVDDFSSNVDEFRTGAPEVTQAFWDGVQSGLE
jgi:hypothetical protein